SLDSLELPPRNRGPFDSPLQQPDIVVASGTCAPEKILLRIVSDRGNLRGRGRGRGRQKLVL
ncbi:unnamed protein product, partial [Heterotrigona itama]